LQNLKGRNRFRDQGVDVRIILKLFLSRWDGCEDMNWLHLSTGDFF